MNAAVQQDQTRRLENLLLMGKRLADAVKGDIAAMERGAFRELRTTDPEIINLAALYARDVAALKAAGGIKTPPQDLARALKETSVELKSLLAHHDKLVLAMRKATEGLVQAVADEVEKTRKSLVPYTPKQVQKSSSAGAAIVCNKVI
jgi:hypothetical protein